jgi:hypothetical protein
MARKTPPAPPPVTTANVPVHTIRHRNIKASIWKNQTAKGVMYDVRVTRSYKENDVWHDSTSFGYDDLMNVAKLLSDAHSVITELRRKDHADVPRSESRRRDLPAA